MLTGEGSEEGSDQLTFSFDSSFTSSEEVNIHYIGGSCVTHVLKHNFVCDGCKNLLNSGDGSDEQGVLTEFLNVGGLKNISGPLYELFKKAESAIQCNMSLLLKQSRSFTQILKPVLELCKSDFPRCCNVAKLLLDHYIVVRGLGIKSFEICKKGSSRSYGSKSVEKKSSQN